MIHISAGIVTYNPKIRRLRDNISAIRPQVSKLLIVDNGSINIENIRRICQQMSVDLIELNENKGIAYALNTICEYYYNNSIKWTITLDQDSVSPPNLVTELAKYISKDAGVIGPNIIYRNNERYSHKNTKSVENVEWLITSASLTNLVAWKKIGGFDNKLFIDGVDKDLCLSMKKKGYHILKINSVSLMHELGNLHCKSLFGRTIYVTNHSPFRLYYMIRNSFYLDKKHNMNHAFSCTTKHLIKVLLFEKYKCRKIKAIVKGIKNRNEI